MSDLLTADIPLGFDRCVRILFPEDLTPAEVEKMRRVLVLLVEPIDKPEEDEDA
jgi:hypothetical protein